MTSYTYDGDGNVTSMITPNGTTLTAYDLDDRALQRDLGPMPRTPLADGIRQTLEQFRKLNREGRLDTADLE